MELSADILYIVGGIVTTGLGALGAKYYAAKVLIAKLDGVLSFADDLVSELSELVSRINIAIEDDTLSKEEIEAIMAELNDVVEKLKAAVKLVKNKEVPE